MSYQKQHFSSLPQVIFLFCLHFHSRHSAAWWHISFCIITLLRFHSIICFHSSLLCVVCCSQRVFFFACSVSSGGDSGATPCLPNRRLTNKPSCRSCSPSTRRTTSSTPSKCCRRKSSWRKKRWTFASSYDLNLSEKFWHIHRNLLFPPWANICVERVYLLVLLVNIVFFFWLSKRVPILSNLLRVLDKGQVLWHPQNKRGHLCWRAYLIKLTPSLFYVMFDCCVCFLLVFM